jgi:chemotaxis protein methyltransferase CheR
MDDAHGIGLADHEFRLFQQMIFDIAGINLSPSKKPLVSGRLARRVRHYGFGNYGDYFRHITKPDNAGERQVAVDLLTTNETFFFREPRHFALLRESILPPLAGRQTVRIWSAACSSGEEPYSLAMTLAEVLGERQPWEIVASDISMRVLEKAAAGLYPMERAADIPPTLLARYCLKGIDSAAGTFLVDRRLRSRMQFMQVNLNAPLPKLGEFDAIFLRNVMIYFDMATKQQVLQRLLPHVKPGGYIIVGHSESLHGVTGDLVMTAPSVYRKP